MSKEDTAPGLLSKMVKFVRNPATNWSDLDGAQSDREDSMSKQLLKEMIERKRRNDFVRKREFDMLRKMRKRESVGGVGHDAAGRPSFFQSSMPSKPDDRASTLKKIDEIEAQMSMQWWKTKNGSPPDSSMLGALGNEGAPAAQAAARPGPVVDAAASVPGAVPTVGTPLDERRLPTAYQPTVPATLQSLERQAAARNASNAPAAARAGSTPPADPPVVTDALTPARPAMRPPAPPPAARAPVAAPSAAPAFKPAATTQGPPSMGFSNGLSDFSNSKFTAVDVVGAFTHDTELEEAAIRFANGDDTGAEAGLLEILAPGGLRTEHSDTWLTLFDLYRATAQQDKFEAAAIQFVERFDRSAPQWFSMPDMVKQLAESGNGNSPVAGNGPAADWICPSAVGSQTVAALKAALAKAAMPWRLDWSNLKTIDDSAVDALLRVFSGWAATTSQLRFIGEAQLRRVLVSGTPSNERGTAQNRWQLRMEALRVMNQPDDFEMAALDFCVTYEVSPPSWESARCQYRPIDANGGADTIIGDVYRDSMQSSLMAEGDSAISQLDSHHSMPGDLVGVELSGQIQGDPGAALDRLDARLRDAEVMHVSCARLIRVDFSAAGTLLNWVSARQAENRTVHFSDVNRLVAAFFNVIGITEHASVTVRVD